MTESHNLPSRTEDAGGAFGPVASAVSLVLMACAAQGLLGCRGQQSEQTPIVPIRNMHAQPRYSGQSVSEFFEDGRELRPPVAGTVATTHEVDDLVLTGEGPNGWVSEIPTKVVARNSGLTALAERGETRFNIYCAPCHGYAGDGAGSVNRKAKVGAFAAPSLQDERIRHIPDGQLYATIANGIRSMPGQGHTLKVDDRWAVVAYVRALQLQQHLVAQD